MQEIVLGFDKVEDYFSEDYLRNYPYFGSAIGRYANRIRNGEFSIHEKKYQLAKNKITDHLHGGMEGFDKKVWEFISGDDQHLKLSYTSAHNEEGYPGTLEVELHFELTDSDELIYEYFAHTDKSTIVNLTHHSYFNLDGSEDINSHIVSINAATMLEQDDNFVVTGVEKQVGDTIYDFRMPRPVNHNWDPENGYDQSFVLDKKEEELNFAAEAFSEISRLKLEVYTTEPLVHFYTGKWIPQIPGKNDMQYGPFSGLCFETQKHPNAINIPHFPDTVLLPGHSYHTKTFYRIIQ